MKKLPKVAVGILSALGIIFIILIAAYYVREVTRPKILFRWEQDFTLKPGEYIYNKVNLEKGGFLYGYVKEIDSPDLDIRVKIEMLPQGTEIYNNRDHTHNFSGIFIPPGDAIIKIDNSYSLLTSKNVVIKLEIKDKLEELIP